MRRNDSRGNTPGGRRCARVGNTGVEPKRVKLQASSVTVTRTTDRRARCMCGRQIVVVIYFNNDGQAPF